MKIEELRIILQMKLTPKRYKHSLGVRDTAVILAKRFGGSIEKAEVAGLMHDCAREFSEDKLLKMADEFNIGIGKMN